MRADLSGDRVRRRRKRRRARRNRDQEAAGDQGCARPVRRRSGGRQEGAVRRRVQPLQAHPLHERQEERRRIAEIQHRHARPDGLRQDLPRPDAGKDPERAVRHRRRHEPDRGRLRRRGRRKHPAAAHPERRLRRRARPATRSTRSPARARTRRSRATSAARACSRRF